MLDDIRDEMIPKDMLDLASHIVKRRKGHFEPSAAPARTLPVIRVSTSRKTPMRVVGVGQAAHPLQR
jgi:hypothetical protein